MEVLKYKVIKSATQYNKYCKALEALTDVARPGRAQKDEIELLTLLIETWDAAHTTFSDLDPIALLTGLMDEHRLKPKDLVTILGISKGIVSEILHYKKGLSKESIRKLAAYFELSQEAFNRPYPLKDKAAVTT
jgi:HTH-type transcriptional regulator/antitoxin HigA